MPEEARMNERTPEFTHQVLQPAMHQKILFRAAELVAMGWTRGTAARDATGQKVRSTAPQATAWCVVGAAARALYQLLDVEVYALLGLEVAAYDPTPCPPQALKWEGGGGGGGRGVGGFVVRPTPGNGTGPGPRNLVRI